MVVQNREISPPDFTPGKHPEGAHIGASLGTSERAYQPSENKSCTLKTLYFQALYNAPVKPKHVAE